MNALTKAFYICVLLITLWSTPVFAQNPRIIRDTEIEEILRGWLAPLLVSARIPTESVNLILVQDAAVNAFVAGGANIFLYTGLIDRTENPGELIGVMAHELGHIEGGHLIASHKAMERASYESILGAVIGVGAAILGGGEAGTAIMHGSRSMAERGFLAHSRVQESSADQAAIRFMNGAQINPSGIESFFGKLAANELVSTDEQSEYVRTHPLTTNRIEAVQANVRQSPFIQSASPAQWVEDHTRIKAKLMGYINPGRVPWVYDERDPSFAAHYARAIAAYRQSHIDKALDLTDGLIQREPENPYLYELKGQMLVEFGRVKEGIAPLRKAVALKPNSGLIRTILGHALIETNDYQAAITELERALQDEPRSARIHRFLARAYGRADDKLMADAHLAEEATLRGRREDAKTIATRVLQKSPSTSRAHQMAQDLLAYLELR